MAGRRARCLRDAVRRRGADQRRPAASAPAGGAPPQLRLECTRSCSGVRLSIEDNGAVFDPTAQALRRWRRRWTRRKWAATGCA